MYVFVKHVNKVRNEMNERQQYLGHSEQAKTTLINIVKEKIIKEQIQIR